MALKLPTDCNNTGLIAEYWKITNIVKFDVTTNQCLVELKVYKDLQARQEGKNPAIPTTILIEGEAFDRILNNSESDIRAKIYGEIKLLEPWLNAQDA